ncbi:sugar ABC transporter substrate-binding protein [Actinomadura viridis]|uniref:Multiple sugar transport system substrate-binding protein n=1 Tax=Actinomadura viridis TaxID=58110 RepID=A0A931DID1_9ACTN|nr:sugar ABC transporter substrate-binding protein [Actinomadura viridis]MBG6091739.1 multiple sugar transport system substrate-binding protein [Actinomadura viridis]
MKPILSRVLAPLTVLSAAAALTTACGGSDASSNSLTVWMYPVIADQQASRTYWQQIEKDFEAAESGLDLKIELQPWDNRDQKVATALAGGNGPDIVLLGPDQVPQYVQNRTLAPVDDVTAGAGSSFLPGSLKALSVEGKLYAAPIYHTITSTIYNKELLDKAGIKTPPQTWDEIRAAAPKLKEAGVATLDYSASPEASLNLNFYPLLWQAGGTVFTPDGKKAAFNGPAGVEALTFLVDLYKDGAVPKSGLSNKNVFADQALGKKQVAMGFANVPADVKIAAGAWGKENVIVGLPLRHRKQVGFGLPGGLGVNARSKNKANADRFLRFMIDPKRITSLTAASGFLSPRTDVKAPAADETTAKFAEALPYAHSGEANVSARQVMSLLSAEIQATLTGKKEPRQALDDAAKQADDLLARQR